MTALERDELTARWVALVAERDAGKVAQPAPVSEAKGGRGNEGGIRKAARELDMPRDAVRRAVKVAALSPEAKEAARTGNTPSLLPPALPRRDLDGAGQPERRLYTSF